jgi:heme/copper-type cytochrome/quinol oxidase subunit 4
VWSPMRSCWIDVTLFAFRASAINEMRQLIKLLHPNAQGHEIRRHVRAFYFALAFGILISILVAGIIYLMYNSNRFLS